VVAGEDPTMGGFNQTEEAKAQFKSGLAKLLVIYAVDTAARADYAAGGNSSSTPRRERSSSWLFSKASADKAAAASAGRYCLCGVFIIIWCCLLDRR